jgi:hypothetical protein
MVRSRQRLLRAVRLLGEISNSVGILAGGRGSSRALLVRLKRLRALLHLELEQPTPNWTAVVPPLLREVVRWVVEWISNLQYLFSLPVGRHEGVDRGTWTCLEVLPHQSRPKTKGVGSTDRSVACLPLAHRGGEAAYQSRAS